MTKDQEQVHKYIMDFLHKYMPQLIADAKKFDRTTQNTCKEFARVILARNADGTMSADEVDSEDLPPDWEEKLKKKLEAEINGKDKTKRTQKPTS